MAFDTEKNYAEFGNAFFRGRLKGAKGEARFKLTARAINAVDTVNIRGLAVTWNFYKTYTGFSAPGGQSGYTYVTLQVDVLDEVILGGVYIELICFAQQPDSEDSFSDYEPTIYVDGVPRPSYAARNARSRIYPFNEVVHMTKGSHTVSIVGRSPTSADGYIFCRYIRPTGNQNNGG